MDSKKERKVMGERKSRIIQSSKTNRNKKRSFEIHPALVSKKT